MENTNAVHSVANESWTRTKVVTRIGIFVALSVVGALLKIPSPTGTVALDSAAGYFSAVAFGIFPGAVIAALGHLVSAATAGFPLTLPIHLLVALEMAVFAASFAYLSRKINITVAVVVVTLLNGVLAPLSMVPLFGMAFFVAMVVPLLIGSAVNVCLAAMVFKSTSRLGAVWREH